MPRTIRIKMRSGRVIAGLTGALALGCSSGDTLAQEAQIQAAEVLEESVIGFAQIEGGGAEDELGLNYQPGFGFMMADEDLQSQISHLNSYFEKGDWAKAFRLLTELGDEPLRVMVALGGQGRHVMVKEALQQRLLSLPPDGRRARRRRP